MERRKAELLRIIGYRGSVLPEGLEEEIAAAWSDIEKAASPRFVWRIFPVCPEPDGIRVKDTTLLLSGASIRRYLQGCRHAALMACTMGAGVDRLIAGTEVSDMPRALLLDACASCFAEETAENVCREIEKSLPPSQKTIGNRFSPGYGDLSLDIHPQFLRILDAGRRIGLTETAQHTLLPRKSITALTGIKTLTEQ